MSIGLSTFGPADHGRPVTADERSAAEYEPGFKYEVIDGRLYVSPQPGTPENRLENWLFIRLLYYSAERPEVVNYVTTKARVFVPGRSGPTAPEPDIAAYRDFPVDADFDAVDWGQQSPVLVAEVLVDGDPDKDLVRNAELYFEVPAIREYWVVDGRGSANRPSVLRHRREGDRVVLGTVPFGAVLTTDLLPGFSLVVDPRR